MPLKSLNLNLRPMIKKLEVTLKRGDTQDTTTSTFRSVFRGRGLEFDRFRTYTPSDDARDIDWKVSMKANELLVRVLTEERNINVAFLLDVSDGMVFASGDKLKCEYAAELVAAMAFAMIASGDNVELVMFSDKVVKHIRSNTGMNQFYMISKGLSNPELYGGDFGMEMVMRYATKMIKGGSIVFLISDFIALGDTWRPNLETMGRKFDLIGVMVRDLRDNSLEGASGQFVLANPRTGDDILVDLDLTKERFGVYAQEQVKDVETAFKHVGADILVLQTDKEFMQPIMNLFSMRRHRWR